MEPSFSSGSGEFDIVVVGASLGGLSALEILLRELPRGFPLPVVIVKHRGSDSDDLIGIAFGDFLAAVLCLHECDCHQEYSCAEKQRCDRLHE